MGRPARSASRGQSPGFRQAFARLALDADWAAAQPGLPVGSAKAVAPESGDSFTRFAGWAELFRNAVDGSAREALLSLPIVESYVEIASYLEAASLYRSARRSGLTIRSPVDCLIASCALRHDLGILHYDRDYTSLARITPLRQREA